MNPQGKLQVSQCLLQFTVREKVEQNSEDKKAALL
jgi:hypothetical protein